MSLDIWLTRPCHCGEPTCDEGKSAYDANYTHNIGDMADAVGLYRCIWHLDGVTHAGDLIPKLEAGLEKLQADPAKYKAMNPSNGWGSYETFVPWLKELLTACKETPEAIVSVDI